MAQVQQGTYLRFLREITRPVKRPAWTTPNTVLLELGNVLLRDFSRKSRSKETPILILPPQAGHHSSIADYGPGQSLVQAVLSVQNSVYVTEWKAATPDRKNETIDDCITSTDKCIDAIREKGSKVNLIGLCQGGWQSAIYTALFPEKVKSLTLAAAPIDFKAGGGKIQFYVEMFPMLFYESCVAQGGGTMPGEYMKLGFKMLNPLDRFVLDYADLYAHLDDPAYMQRHRKFRDWYEYTQDIPGKMYLQIVKELFKENRLVRGGLRILGRYVNLRHIQCPLILLAGNKDDITPPEQLFNIQEYVQSRDVMKRTASAGHIGVFMSEKVLKDYWPQILEKIALQDVPVNGSA